MNEDAPFTAEEIKRLRELLEVDEIKKLILKYSQLLDSGQIDELAQIFTEDAVCEFGPFGSWGGSREAIRESYQKVWESDAKMEFGFMHNTCNHWAELTSDTTAVGRHYLLDVYTYRAPEANPFEWFGVYDSAYEKIDGTWLIKRLALHFLWPSRELAEPFSSAFPS